MNLILNNPYRIIGLLVEATAREQTRQINRLKNYIAADQEPENDFSFPVLGKLHRTVESVEEAASKLNLDLDKINAALFWFWSGNPVTDEVAFEALKDGKIDDAIEIWKKLIYNPEEEINEISNRNASAFFNLSTLYLIKYGINEETLRLKLNFLESDFAEGFKSVVTDETFSINSVELQLNFLNNLTHDGEIPYDKIIHAISKIAFEGKEDFLKEFIQKATEEIEYQIKTAKNIRKENKGEAGKAGQNLFDKTSDKLAQLESFVGKNDIRYTLIADKVANEILQCSIDYFNDNQEKESTSDYEEIAMILAKQAESLASGKLVKDRIKDSIETLEKITNRVLLQAIAILQSIKNSYEEACRQIDEKVEEIQYYTLPSFVPGGKPYKVPNPDVSINWSKVKEMKRHCLAWDKVTDVVRETITPHNINKIKLIDDTIKINEYKTLVNFLMDIIPFHYRKEIKYINYWETENIVANAKFTIKSLPLWSKWLIGIAIFLLLIVLIWGIEGLKVVLVTLGIFVLVGLYGLIQNINRR